MEGILLTTDQIEWFREMLVESFDDEDVQHRILGALEILMRRSTKNWVPALNINKKNENKEIIFADDIKHEKKENRNE